ncbi:MAG TPA: YceI family protein [Puia sp.]
MTPKSNTRYDIDGNLTIKGITHPISFDAEVNNNGDTLICNDFDLDVRITAKAA